jgi:protoporphyrinogen oxidase
VARRADLVVLGGGPAGVGAAYRAAQRGLDVVLLERGDRVGGLAGSFEVAGVRVDHGSHRLHPTTDPVILAELRQLLGDDLQLRRRNGRIRLAGRWIAFPLRPADLARRLPPSFAAAALRDTATSPFRRARADTFAEVLRAKLGPAMCERFYFPYARKLWGLEPGEIAGEQARRRVGADSPLALVRRALAGGRGPRGVFWYPRRGYGQLSEALAEAAAAAGATLRLGAEVTGVRFPDDRATVEVGGAEPIEAGRVFSTLPLPLLARLTEPAPPEHALAAASKLAYRAMVLVYLALRRPRYTEFDAHYLPEAWTPVTRVSEPKNYRDGDDPADTTVLCAEIPCALGDETWSADDDALAAVVLDALGHAELPRAQPFEVVVRRVPRVYPVYRVGYERSLEELEAWAAAQPRLLSFGRQGLFVHDNAHHALAMAWEAAAALTADGFDEASWSRARERFATHVVED